MHGHWQDSSDERDELSSVLSDAMADSVSSGITSPALPTDLRSRVMDLEHIRETLAAELTVANKVALKCVTYVVL